MLNVTRINVGYKKLVAARIGHYCLMIYLKRLDTARIVKELLEGGCVARIDDSTVWCYYWCYQMLQEFIMVLFAWW